MSTRSEKLVFHNPAGDQLAGRLELPNGKPRAYALFAHCFTCSKDIAAASRIARALAREGLAVLRFDFTGLGGSDGDFSNTNFSSNVDDLICAADHLREHYEAPRLLIGHSLGGAAVLVAANKLEEVEAVATIAAPADPAHVRHLIASDVSAIEERGVAEVSIGGRPFKIQKQFLDDLENHDGAGGLSALRKALLVFHSPLDTIVGIDNAERIYKSARGYKSFVTLADADHLLSRKDDAEYVASVLAAWSTRYLPGTREEVEAEEALPHGTVVVEESARPFTNRVAVGRHRLVADEPISVGGKDEGPGPYDYLLAGLGACTSMTLRMYADHKKWPLDQVRVELRHAKIHAEDCAECETKEGRIDRIEIGLVVEGELDAAQRERLLEIAGRCPVHRTLKGEKEIVTKLV
ncbi:MAG: OsmC family protein [bacterium]|nr:OsmC family protein [bacterium]